MKDQLLKLGFADKQERQKVVPRKYKIKDTSFERGRILTMPFEESDGIVIKDGYKTRDKHFIVLGVSENDSIIGSFLINSDINGNIHFTRELIDCQFPLRQKDYPHILSYDSHLDCSEIFEVDKIKINQKGSEIGQLTDSDLNLVIDHIERTEVISAKEKRRFGFEDKS